MLGSERTIQEHHIQNIVASLSFLSFLAQLVGFKTFFRMRQILYQRSILKFISRITILEQNSQILSCMVFYSYLGVIASFYIGDIFGSSIILIRDMSKGFSQDDVWFVFGLYNPTIQVNQCTIRNICNTSLSCGQLQAYGLQYHIHKQMRMLVQGNRQIDIQEESGWPQYFKFLAEPSTRVFV
eukprot:TRINITY_DN1564_c0_g3_i3.p4 TRINITY_DN1564_c0_g3~~TRINITY_DN1564_c0_g3_i3.p4  ORF type:complete len:183 (+),score=2.16 TRINITY_DN1564_c0_g3_i3:84-632(+)